MTTLINGSLGGLVVGLVVARFVGGEPSATAAPLQRTAENRAGGSRRWEFVAGVLYGGLAGLLLLALELAVLGVLAVPPTTVEALGVAVVWSALLFVVWAIVSRSSASPPSTARFSSNYSPTTSSTASGSGSGSGSPGSRESGPTPVPP